MPKENTTIQMFADYEGDISTISRRARNAIAPSLPHATWW